MSATDFKAWMEQTGKSVQDIAYELQVHPQTVYHFLQGKQVRRSTQRAFENLVKQQVPASKRKTAG